jgi:hypothetical protein
MIEQTFFIFGSSTSVDYNVLVIVGHMPEIYTCHEWCVELEYSLQEMLPEKPINVNLGVIKDGVITNVFTGTPDEVNNSVMSTYHLHKQWHGLTIRTKVPREPHLKLLSAARIALSFIKDEKYKDIVKKALTGDFKEKIETLEKINLSDIEGDKISIGKIKKVLAFQFGQTLALLEGEELYTKECIAERYKELEPHLTRDPDAQLDVLEIFKKKFLKVAKKELPNRMKKYDKKEVMWKRLPPKTEREKK